MRRLLALIGALLMVGGALAIRSTIDDDNGGGSNGDGTLRLLCASELANVCDELDRIDGVEVDQVDAGSVTDDSDQLGDYDGWLTFERSAQRVRQARERAQLDPVIERASAPIARSPVIIAIAQQRAEVLAEHCGGDITWQCIGDVGGTPWQSIGGSITWGDVKPAHADPEDTAEGLVIIGQQAAHFFGRENLSTFDFEDDGFLDWLGNVKPPELVSNGFDGLLTTRSATYDVVATLEARTDTALAQRERVELIYPAPVATADVVYASVVDGDSELFDIVTGDDGQDALLSAGFRLDDEGEPGLPRDSNLPPAGALEALLQTWREVTG